MGVRRIRQNEEPFGNISDDAIDFSTETIKRGIEMKMKMRGSKPDKLWAEAITVLIDQIVRGCEEDSIAFHSFGNAWRIEGSNEPELPEVMSMAGRTESKEMALARLRLAHEEFLKSRLAEAMGKEGQPERNREELAAGFANISIPASLIVYEGRER